MFIQLHAENNTCISFDIYGGRIAILIINVVRDAALSLILFIRKKCPHKQIEGTFIVYLCFSFHPDYLHDKHEPVAKININTKIATIHSILVGFPALFA